MNRWCILSILILTACTSVRTKVESDKRTPQSECAQTPAINTETILTLVRTGKIQTVSALLEELKKENSDYLAYHTYMYSSQSLQKATFAEPRAIIFGPDARFIFTFNGHSSQVGGGSVEMMEFDCNQKRFVLREVIFKKESNENGYYESDIEDENEQVLISKRDPIKCMDCHGFLRTSPIWKPYFIWAGAYGSHDDFLFQTLQNNPVAGVFEKVKKPLVTQPFSQGRTFDLANRRNDKEVENFKKFIATKDTHNRFRHLPDRFVDQAYRELISGKTIEEIRFLERSKRLPREYVDRPNLYLLRALYTLNAESIVQALSQEPMLSRLKDIRYEPASYEGDETIWFGKEPFEKTSEKYWTHLRELGIIDAQSELKDFTNYLKDQILRELAMQTETVKIARESLGSLVINSYKKYRYGISLKNPAAFYSSLLKRPLTEDENFASQVAQNEDFVRRAITGYLLKRIGFDLSIYSLNTQNSISYYESGFNAVDMYLKAVTKQH